MANPSGSRRSICCMASSSTGFRRLARTHGPSSSPRACRVVEPPLPLDTGKPTSGLLGGRGSRRTRGPRPPGVHSALNDAASLAAFNGGPRKPATNSTNVSSDGLSAPLPDFRQNASQAATRAGSDAYSEVRPRGSREGRGVYPKNGRRLISSSTPQQHGCLFRHSIYLRT